MKIAHSADWHIGFRRYADPALQQDYFLAAQTCIQKAASIGCRVMLVPGDVLHTNRISSPHPYALKRLSNLAESLGVVVLTIPGNHDYSEPHWSSVISSQEIRNNQVIDLETFPGGVYCIANKLVYLRDSNTPYDVPVYGCAARGRAALDVTDYPECMFFMYHGVVSDFFDFGKDEELVSIVDFDWSKITYALVLGDIHKPMTKRGPQNQIITYPGSTFSTQKSEDVQKSFNVFDLEQNKFEQIEFDAPRETLKVSIKTLQELESLIREVKNTPNKKRLIHMIYPGNEYAWLTRLRAAVDKETVIDPDPYYPPSLISKFSASKNPDEAMQQARDMQFSDVVKQMVGGNPVLYELVSGLVNPEVHSVDHIDQWVTKQLEQIEKETTAQPAGSVV